MTSRSGRCSPCWCCSPSSPYDAYAISNDEQVQQHYGELIVAYYRSGFADQSLFHYDNLYLYGGLFDVLAVLAQHLLPFLDPYVVRHLLSALIGIAGIGAAAATARLVAGPRAGAIAGFALAVCGPGTARCSTTPRTFRSPRR